jgi:hypothetical protein
MGSRKSPTEGEAIDDVDDERMRRHCGQRCAAKALFTAMTDPMFVLPDDGDLVELRPEGYLTEAQLQALVARFPDLLPAAGINSSVPRRFVLVRREAGLSDTEFGGARWWVDHVFLDQDAIPTLVEVKRASDTRIRREVVGQMLDYAAWAVTFWTTDKLRAWFEEECDFGLATEADVLGDKLGVGDPEGFWGLVKTNLQAGRIRMLFVADAIPLELRRVVEFLNQQLDPAEVLAIEIAQYRGEQFTTFVPRVMGQTEKAQAAKSSARAPRQRIDIATSRARLAEIPELAELAQAAHEWATSLGLGFRESDRAEILPTLDHLGTRYPLFSIHEDGQVHLPFGWWLDKPILGNEDERRTVSARIGEAIGATVRGTKGFPVFPAALLGDQPRRQRFFAVFGDVVTQIRAYAPDA